LPPSGAAFFIPKKLFAYHCTLFDTLKKIILISPGLLLFFTIACMAQRIPFSISTDLDLQHSFKKGQRYWAVGQTVQGLFSFSQKNGMYIWLSYYSNGTFRNDLYAEAKEPSTTPQFINFTNQAQMRYKHVSVGWKTFLKGSCNNEDSWNLYGFAGLGLMLGRIENKFSAIIDTADYSVPVNRGKANFKRLTLDLGLGWEVLLGGNVYFYNEARAEIPTTDYPSPYLFVNKNAPFMASVNFGIRIVFD